MITCLGNQKNLWPSQIHVKSKPQHDCSDRVCRISFDSPGQWVEISSHNTAIFIRRGKKKKTLIFRLCHTKATACQEDSTPEAKHAVTLFSCVCMCMLVLPHLHVACGIQMVRSGFPSHFPFYLLKQGLLLNPKLVDSSNLTTQMAWGFPSYFPNTGITGSLHGHLAFRWVLRNQTLVLMFAGQELCPLNHLTSSHAVILEWENKLLYMICPLLEIKTSYSYARQGLLPLSKTRSPKILSKSGKLMRSTMIYRYENAAIKPNTMLA